jgi:magnesium transporter
VITVRHAETPNLHRVRLKLEARPELLRRGPFAIVHAILDRVVDDYVPVVAGIENDMTRSKTMSSTAAPRSRGEYMSSPAR